MSLKNLTLSELLGSSLYSKPCVSIQKQNKVWEGSVLLIHYLESFTDSLVVTDKNFPIGVLGGKDIIQLLPKESTSNLFDGKLVEQIMNPEIHQINKETQLADLLEYWKKTRRAFSIISNHIGGYSAISARSLLEIGIKCKTDILLSELPKKDTITFKSDDSIGKIIQLMLDNGTRKLLHENSDYFISDRIILEKIARDLNYLRNTKNFLETPANEFDLNHIKKLDSDTPIVSVYEMMFGMIHPYILFEGKVYSPWDLCLALELDSVTLNH